VLSLGTGQQIQSYDTNEVAKWGVFKWMAYKGAPLVDMVFNASADMVDYNLSIIFASQKSSRNYLRIQVTFVCKLSSHSVHISFANSLHIQVTFLLQTLSLSLLTSYNVEQKAVY
jgi:hypothetical protein